MMNCRRRAILSGNSRAILSSAPKPFCHIKKSDAVSIAPGKPHKSLMSLPRVALSSLRVKPEDQFFSSGFVFDSCGRITTAQSRRLYLNNSTATMTAILQSWRRFPASPENLRDIKIYLDCFGAFCNITVILGMLCL